MLKREGLTIRAGVSVRIKLTCQDVNTMLQNERFIRQDVSIMFQNEWSIRHDVSKMLQNEMFIRQNVSIMLQNEMFIRQTLSIILQNERLIRQGVSIVLQKERFIRQDVSIMLQREDLTIRPGVSASFKLTRQHMSAILLNGCYLLGLALFFDYGCWTEFLFRFRLSRSRLDR